MMLRQAGSREFFRQFRHHARVYRPNFQGHRLFHASPSLKAVRPYILADIGEGITECQIISWSVKPGDKVEQFDTICEVSSDKATVEITSRFDGTIRALHYEENDVAVVGKPLLDIDIEDEASALDPLLGHSDEAETSFGADGKAEDSVEADIQAPMLTASSNPEESVALRNVNKKLFPVPTSPKSSFEATPAVRQLLKQHNISISDLKGTGKDGRVTKEDVERHLSSVQAHTNSTPLPSERSEKQAGKQDHVIRLSPTENSMFKAMTRSLSIPHFLYSHSVDMTRFNNLRSDLARSNVIEAFRSSEDESVSTTKLTSLPFIMKALSQVFTKFPRLNSHLDTTTDASSPRLILKSAHNFGIAVDTPQGLLVPVVQNVQDHSIFSLAAEIRRISDVAREGRLRPEDFQNATFSVSNIGSIGGDCQAVSPVIVAPMVGILGVGRISDVPVFRSDKQGAEHIVKEQQVILSWSADHRIIDGATVAKAADMLATLLHRPESLGLILR